MEKIRNYIKKYLNDSRESKFYFLGYLQACHQFKKINDYELYLLIVEFKLDGIENNDDDADDDRGG